MTRSRTVSSLAGLALLLAACGGQANETQGGEQTTPATSTGSVGESSTTSTTQSMEATDDDVPDYAALIATVESALEGTSYEGAPLENGEVFVATAEVFCDLLDEGMSADEILADYLDRLSDDGAIELAEEDGLMAGVLLGAAVEVVCPEHSEETP